MKKKREDLTDKQFIASLDALYTAAGSIHGRKMMKLFLRDLLTPSERIMLGRRIIIARMLLAGETHREITKKLRLSLTTITKVERWLGDQFPGYETAVKEMEKEFNRRANKHAPMFTFAWLKRKYPLHFLLFPQPKIKHGYGEYTDQT